MRRLGSLVLGVVLLIASVNSAAVTAEDILVVTKAENEVPTSTEAGPTTEEPLLPIKLSEMRVHSEISLRYARTAVVAHVRNAAKRSQEALFRVLLPETAFISGFIMTLDGKSYKAYVKEKEKAKEIYNQAVSQGIGAAHISAKARDSNHFTVSVNVEGNTTAVFNLTYEELLNRRNGVYNHAINLHPGALVPKMKVTVHIKESEKITTLRVPEVRTGNEIDATAEDAQNPNAAIDRRQNDHEATITFKPDVEEQKRLFQLYAMKSKESAQNTEGTIGQFVVQYDVDRSKNDQVLVNDGYFVHFLAPTSLPPLKKHVVFVFDTSGSMMGRKVEQLREALHNILNELHPGDYFSIVEFNSNVMVHDLKEAEKPQPQRHYYYGYSHVEPTLVPPSPVTPENIENAKIIISRLQAYGGTNINSALSVAIDLIRKGINWKVKSSSNETTTESTTSEHPTVAQTEEDNSLAKANGPEDLEPIIIFLTDGDPTEGITDTARILTLLSEKNYGEKKAPIYCLAFGEDADRNFLRKVSLRNEGFMRHIYEAADAVLQLKDFYQQVSSPLLSNVEFIYPKDQMKEGTVTRRKFKAVFAGGEVVVAGKIDDDVELFEPHVEAFCGSMDGYKKKKYEISPKIPVTRGNNEYLPLERLWAYLTIKQLLDEKDAADSDVKFENSPEKKALDIALKYEFVTPLTSLVVVKPNATHAINAESVDKEASHDFLGLNLTPLSGAPMSSSLNYFASPNIQPYVIGGPPAYSSAAMYEEEDNFAPDRSMFTSRISGFHSNHFRHRFSNTGGRVAAHRKHFLASQNHHVFDTRFEDFDLSTPALPTTTTEQITTVSYLNEYHLEDYKWIKDIYNQSSGVLDVSVNGQVVHLKLTKELTAPRSKNGDETCEKSTAGPEGVCVYLTRCHSAVNLDYKDYGQYQCTVGDGFAGVCCPKVEVDKN